MRLLAGLLHDAFAVFDLQFAQTLVGLAIHGRVGAMRCRQIFGIMRRVDGVVGEVQCSLQLKIAPRRIERLLRGDGAKQVERIAFDRRSPEQSSGFQH